MTQKAIHQRTGALVTPEEFIALEGADHRSKGVLPLCPQCGAALAPYGVHSLKVMSRFDHPDGSQCPSSSTPDSRYAHLVPTDWDLEQGKRLRSALCDDPTRANLKAVYAACLALCGKLSGIEFAAMCRKADHLQVWRYKGVTLTWLPYVLVTLTDLPIVAGKRRWPLRMVLHKPAQTTLDVLWIRPEMCSLVPFFADTGRPMERDPIPIPYANAESAREDIAWIGDRLLLAIEKCCVAHASSHLEGNSKSGSGRNTPL